MSEWYSKYPNDDGEYEITFKSKNKDLTKAVEKVCCAIMEGVVKSRDDVDFKLADDCRREMEEQNHYDQPMEE